MESPYIKLKSELRSWQLALISKEATEKADLIQEAITAINTLESTIGYQDEVKKKKDKSKRSNKGAKKMKTGKKN